MDLMIVNGKIVTMDVENPLVAAVAVKNGRIVAVGQSDEILKQKTAQTKIIDLHGKLMLPGFNDSHMHLLGYGSNLQKVDLIKTKSIDDIIRTTSDFINNYQLPKYQWVQGRGWNHHIFPTKEMPNRFDLDQISTDHPIVLYRVCGHVASLNSKALELMGIIDNPSHIQGGHIDVDVNGQALGILRENAMELIHSHIPEPSKDQMKNWIIAAGKKVLEQGITSVQTDDFVVVPKRYIEIMNAYEELVEDQLLPVRVYEQSNLPKIAQLLEFLKSYQTGKGDDFFKVGPLKLLTDGSLGARTAYLTSPYADDPTTSGIAVFEQEDLDQSVSLAHNNGMQVALHAIGDKAIEMVLNSIEKAMNENPREDHRHSIIHCQITNNQLLDRMKKLGVIGLVQPLFVATDLHFVEERIGKERAASAYNWRTMIEKNIPIAFGSDAPVESFNVLDGIYAAVTRKDLNGFPSIGWLPDQKITVEDAVYAYTLGAAYASFEETVKGSITPNKLADFVVLSEDIFTINPDQIKDVKVEMTFVDGKLVYQR